MSEDERFDGVLLSIVQQAGGIDGFFNAVFGLLRRKTDFFSDRKRAEEVIVKHSQEQFKKWEEGKKKEEVEAQKRKEREDAKKQAQQQNVGIKKEEVQKKKEEQKQEEKTQENKENVAEEKQAPLGNGGITEKYVWTQTLEELHVFIPVPKATEKKDLDIVVGTSTCKAGIKGQVPLVEGEFFEKIKADDSFWTLEDGEKGQKVIHLAIQKWKGQMHWWDCVIKGHEKIDTQKIQPEPSNISDLDGETAAIVKKMLFDQQQKQKGEPTSDEILKQEKLKEFMKAHPEMDFSKTKFS